ncbi:DUF262 domain-containing protein [Leisingera caerulea]|uniref:DUF262 domain-containing protein n=1 Tax=Leisingera caerulea TaxID=506591 RepID=UPI00055C52BD|nr:DUF262 domain-containing protein [Leisingera caerulea]
MKTPSYHADPHVTYLSQLLEEIREGLIQVPRFQRPFVWDWEDRLELLRSIRDGIPMGAIYVWRSPEAALDCYRSIGPHKIVHSGSSPQYLLDGVQRLTTLLGALSPLDEIDVDADEFVEADGEPPTENYAVHYDFETGDFVREQDFRKNSSKPTLPMSLLLDSVGMLKFQRNLSGSDEEIDEMIGSCDKLAAAFREYKLPVIPIATDDVELATRTFQRLNSRGKPMNEAHMIHALSWGSEFNLNSRLHEVKVAQLSDPDWWTLDDDVLLKACKLALGFGVYSKHADDIGAAFKERTNVVDEVGSACGKAVAFIVEKCGISRPDLLPYAFQLILLTDAFRKYGEFNSQQETDLVSWVWATTYGEYFAGMSGDRVEKARKDLEKGLVSGNWHLTQFDPFEVRALNRKFDFRAVRAKAFALRMADNPDNHAKNSGKPLLKEFGRECLVQLLPRTDSQKILYSSYANRFIVDPRDSAKVKAQLLEGDFCDEMLHDFLLDEDMLRAVKQNNHSEFIERRLAKIASTEKAFYKPHLEAVGLDA